MLHIAGGGKNWALWLFGKPTRELDSPFLLGFPGVATFAGWFPYSDNEGLFEMFFYFLQ